MANTIFRSNYPNKALQVVGLFCVMLLVQKGGATDFTVGGNKGWSVPDPNGEHYNQWAERNRFQVGDSLVFVYPGNQDSVLHVSQEQYGSCDTSHPMEVFSDGHTVFKLKQSGPFYFISGNKDNCLKSEKLVVIVLADRSNRSDANQTTTSSPPPSESTGAAPSPAPAGEESPPAGTVEINPTPAPVSPPPGKKKNAASSVSISFMGSLGAVAVSSLLFLS